MTAVLDLTSTDGPGTAGLDLHLGGFAGISLPELNACAARMTRVDRKYVLPVASLQPVLSLLTGTAQALQIDGSRVFAYHSLYYDTAALDSYRLAGQARRRRWKVRVRTYADSGGSFLEVKTRGPRGVTVKRRIQLAHGRYDRTDLDPAGAAFVDAELRAAGIAAPLARVLRPTLATSYRRATLVVPGAGSAAGIAEYARATVDVVLTWSSADGSSSVALPELAVVETKAGSTPTALDRILWRAGHRPVRISKYGTGLAALRPELPDLKWHCTLARHLPAGAAA